MIIVSDYELRSNKDDQIICLSQEAHAYCPECSGELSYRDSRLRICRTYGGETFHIQIRRLKCHRCHRLHNELPNILVPHKHYSAEVIEDVVDEVVTPEDVVVEDCPCTATMERWKSWICRVTPAIDSMLRSIGCRMLNFTDELLLSSSSLLGSLRDGGDGWMATVMHTLCITASSSFPASCCFPWESSPPVIIPQNFLKLVSPQDTEEENFMRRCPPAVTIQNTTFTLINKVQYTPISISNIQSVYRTLKTTLK